MEMQVRLDFKVTGQNMTDFDHREQEIHASSGADRLCAPQKPQKRDSGDYVALIDHRTLKRECLVQTLNEHGNSLNALGFSSLGDWRATEQRSGRLRAVLYHAAPGTPEEVDNEIAAVVAEFEPVAVVVLAEDQDLRRILKIIELGVRGYIPTSVDIDVCIQAINLAAAGGRFLPAGSFLSARGFLGLVGAGAPTDEHEFTPRQSAIADALRRGKANRLIAREMNLSESTVKVHIRNIMKKLGATNRTEVAFKIGDPPARQLAI
jgi:DNA-binding NarL/FixJ family response regulator